LRQSITFDGREIAQADALSVRAGSDFVLNIALAEAPNPISVSQVSVV
jgi:uncharacterized protein (DUF1778 family)